MEIEIRPARPEEIPDVIRLMREFAEFEKLLDSFEITAERFSEVVFGENRFVELMIAAKKDNLVGYALFYPCFASFKGQKGLFLEDIYVSSDYRGQGIGELLLREVARFAHSQGCERIDFQVLEWNAPAIAFYEKLGAKRNNDERHFKFAGEAFRNLSS
jgi:ribosomal protein S18 acetylase RimI-like enzyme